MGAVLTIAAKDLRQRLRDRSAILMAVVIPLVLGVWWTMHVLKDRLIKTSKQK